MGISKIIKNDIGLPLFFFFRVQNVEKSVNCFISFSIAWKI